MNFSRASLSPQCDTTTAREGESKPVHAETSTDLTATESDNEPDAEVNVEEDEDEEEDVDEVEPLEVGKEETTVQVGSFTRERFGQAA